MRAFIAVAVLLVGAQAFLVTPENAEAALRFASFKSQFGKVYADEAAEQHAFENFQVSLERVAQRQVRGLASQTQWGVTKFSDLSPAEFRKILGYVPPAERTAPVAAPAKLSAVPPTFDWRTKHAVTAVKDQGQCGSCWAFSATESIESMSFLAGNTLTALAPEQIVDCDTVDQGCNGGNTETAFEYVTGAGGLDTEASYPYTAGDSGSGGPCEVKKVDFKAKINNYTYAVAPCEAGACNKQNETGLREQLVAIGPLAICVNADPWQDYSGGVLDGADCPHALDDLDHCVQLVGFDWNNNYWIVRNSWNTDWGENGYIRLQTMQNTCGLANDANFANALKL